MLPLWPTLALTRVCDAHCVHRPNVDEKASWSYSTGTDTCWARVPRESTRKGRAWMCDGQMVPALDGEYAEGLLQCVHVAA